MSLRVGKLAEEVTETWLVALIQQGLYISL